MTGNVLRSPLVLPEDLLIIPVSDLPDEVREKLGDGGEEFAITRPLAREPSKLIDAAAARLIEQFREPKTIVQAVISYSRTNKADPERTLEDSLPLLRQLIGSGLLLPEGAQEARRIEAAYTTGAEAGPFRIVRCIQVLDDSELYQARDSTGAFVALKIAREGHTLAMQDRLDREASVLRHLGGTVSPRLMDRGAVDGRPFLAIEWISGADVVSVAADLREQNDRDELLKLIVAVAHVYAAIHRCGVLHGDVHPGNLLARRDGAVTLIDFGLARIEGLSADLHLRGGVGFFMEPEYAREVLDERPPAPLTPQAEQFAVGALLYMLATGHTYMDFTLQQEEMFRQIRDAAPLPFSERGVESWLELEAVLCRALAIAPASRHLDMARFAEALTKVASPPSAPAVRTGRGAYAIVSGMLDHVALDGALYRDGPSQGPLCSVNFGSSGIAYGLYRLACRRDDPNLLAAADAWIMKAEREAERDSAFYNPALDMTEATIGRVSPYHARPGLSLVQAVIAAARGESGTRDAAARAYLASIETPCLERDLALGRTGTVLGCALLLETLPYATDPPWLAARHCGEQRLNDLWTETSKFDSIEGGQQWPNLGVAHGWAGLLYVTFRWHLLTGMEIPAAAQTRLVQLVDMARPTARGVTWPWRQNPNDDYLASMPGWCNGSAGMVHLTCIAHRILGEDALLESAEAGAWHAWEGGEGPVDLCCGYAGRAYALLELHRSTNDAIWFERARELADRAVRIAPQLRTADHPRHSLYKGELGLALLLADLEQPETAAMPMFGPEG
jgi:eukaryotic-like serine/threonine-protein kinase